MWLKVVFMDELIENSFKLIAKGLYFLARISTWLIFEFLYEEIAWWLGWCVCRAITLNSRPKVGIHGYDEATTTTRFVVCLTGIATIVLAGAALAIYISANAT
jgi:hypothetical protein